MAESNRLNDILRFIQDIKALKEQNIHQYNYIAEKLNVDAGNLSNILSGKILPKESHVKDFFEIFEEDLKKLSKEGNSNLGERKQDQKLSRLDKLVDSHHNVSQAMNKQADSHRLLAEAELIQAKNNQEFMAIHSRLISLETRNAENPGAESQENQDRQK